MDQHYISLLRISNERMENMEWFDEVKEMIAIACGEKVDEVLELWERLKESLKYIDLYEDINLTKYNWNVPIKIVRKSQVLNRKPIMSVARSNC